MKILFTGGGTGGHFYPIMAVADEIIEESRKERLLEPELYFMSPTPYDSRALFDRKISYRKSYAGKIRRYFSFLNFTDLFKTLWGMLYALLDVFAIFPDVVFGKGGYASFPAIFAARILRIPVVIHESDSKPGRVNAWAGKFARKIAVSYPEAAHFFPAEKVAFTGNPIRKEIQYPANGGYDFFKLEPDVPTILILGGSQGSAAINDVVLDALQELVKDFQIIHQTGKNNFTLAVETAKVVLRDDPHSSRYHPLDYLGDVAMRMASGAAETIVSRAGSTIFEIAAWGKPSIIIPLPESVSHDQTRNSLAYARTGAARMIEQANLAPSILVSELRRVHESPELRQQMAQAAKKFAKLDAAQKIARVILEIALEHER